MEGIIHAAEKHIDRLSGLGETQKKLLKEYAYMEIFRARVRRLVDESVIKERAVEMVIDQYVEELGWK